MANQEDDPDLRADNNEEIEAFEQSVKRGKRIIDMLAHQCRRKITDPQEAETLNSAIKELAEDQEDVMRCLSHLREVRDAKEDLEGLRQASGGIKLEGDQCEDGSTTGKKISFARRWFLEKLRSESGESSGEGATDVVGQLRQLSTEFEANLYFLLAQLASLTPQSKKEKFKSSLQRLAKDSENEIVRGILDLVDAFPWQVSDSGSSKGKVDKERRIDSLLDQFFKNIQLVVFLIGQISLLADRFEECEAEQKAIESKIKALKEMD